MISTPKMEVPFHVWQAEEAGKKKGVLVLMPGYNGLGKQMLDERWKAFATKEQLILLAPTFSAAGNENNLGRGYYYPEQGSGEVLELALQELERRSGVSTQQVLFFGFSAGAHVSHRFALWKPERVKAFVAYSAGWWSEPTEALKAVPALILCGEADERYKPTYQFFLKGHQLGCPWIWRSYDDVGHVLTPEIREMAEVFLHHYVSEKKQESLSYGDFQSFQSIPKEEREKIPKEFRITLPCKRMAEVWTSKER